MKHAVKHDLGPDVAKKVAVAAFDTYKVKFAKYSPTASWTSNDHCNIGFTAKGISLKGTLDLVPGAIELDLDVPFLLRPFQGKALGLIEAEIREWIGKAKAGQI